MSSTATTNERPTFTRFPKEPPEAARLLAEALNYERWAGLAMRNEQDKRYVELRCQAQHAWADYYESLARRQRSKQSCRA